MPRRTLRILVADARSPAALATVRSLGGAGHAVTVGWPEETPRPAACWSRFAADIAEHPDPVAGHAAFEEWLVEAVALRRWDVVWPIGDAATVAAARVRRRLPEGVVYAMAPDASLKYALSRYQAARLAQSAGIPVPKTIFISDGAGTQTWNQDFTACEFPLAIKIDPMPDGMGGFVPSQTRLARGANEARAILRECTGLRAGIIAQEWLAGPGFDAACLRHKGKVLLRFAQRRLHESPWQGGAVALAASYRNEKLTEGAEQLLAAADFDGMALVEFRFHARENRFYFIRLIGRPWDSLAGALHGGADFPLHYLAALNGDPPPEMAAESKPGGRCWSFIRGELGYLASLRREAPEGIKKRPRFGKALRETLALGLNPAVRHDQWWWSDPGPGGAEAVRAAGRGGRSIVRRVAGAAMHRRETQALEAARARHAERMARGAFFDAPPNKILFVCYGNICRSPFAQHYWGKLLSAKGRAAPEAQSAGLHPVERRSPPARILRMLAPYNLPLDKHLTKSISLHAISEADAVFLMDGQNLGLYARLFPGELDKVFLLGAFGGGAETINDPYLLETAEAGKIYKQLIAALEGLLAQIEKDEQAARG